MALNNTYLKQQIKAAFKAQSTKTENPDAALDDLAQKIVDAVHVYLTGATVTVPIAIPCATPAGPGTATGTATGTIS